MRIGLIAPPWLPVPAQGYGAIEAIINDLAIELSAAGHQVTVATTGDSTVPVRRVTTFPRARTDAVDRSSVETLHVLQAYDALHNADIIHDHTIVGPVLGHRRGQRVVTSCHWAITGDVGRLYTRIADEVPTIAISRSQQRLAPGTRFVRVIHHGVDLARFPVGRGDGGYLLVLARMDPSKGVHVAAEVAHRAGTPLLIAGPVRSDSERQYFDTQVRPRLGRGVEYIGEVGGTDKLALLGAARAVLMPIAWDEPFGMVAIEALATGTPVLAFPRGALPELIDHGRTGYLCTDPAAMALSIETVQDLDRAACRAAAEEHFSAHRMAAEHTQLYQTLLNDGHRTNQDHPTSTPPPAGLGPPAGQPARPTLRRLR
jgi:glycosyltransferase involved in cell wall biosynthesis